jgi:hypothetical protein
MKLYSCECCNNLVYFENIQCVRCGSTLGFLPETMSMATIGNPDGYECPHPVDKNGNRVYRKCANYQEHNVCNWMVREPENQLCIACRLNRTIPNLSRPENRKYWHALEIEKRRLIFTLLRLDLPLVPKTVNDSGLAFDFLSDKEETFSEMGRVLTGHDQGLITINIAEADPVEREKMRTKMAEPYRTILGHFRHESGHYYWDLLIKDTGWLNPFRDMFGNETEDYSQAMERHYSQGPPRDWAERFVSSYASMHPWEDWAETWAHYLHIIDTLETAYQFGIQIRPKAGENNVLEAAPGYDPYHQEDIDSLIRHWLPVSFALNSLNRSMGHGHVYPFVLNSPVIAKLGFVHGVVRGAAS